MIEIGLAFVEGLALIVSPCILPVLPLILASSVEGGKRRPYGIIIGFVLAFSLFAVVARKVVALLGLDLEVVRNASLVLLGIFGLILLSSKLSEKFSVVTQSTANWGNRLAGAGGEGLFSGILIGSLIGLVWTPCAGPILAAVLVQVIRQQSDFAGNLIILSFGIGAGVPMLVIALTGRKLMSKLGFLSRHAEGVRKGFGVLILLSVAYIAFGADAQARLTPKNTEATQDGQALRNGISKPYAAPEFADIDAWINSAPLTMQSLKGKVVLVDFWTYSCINCVRTLPYLTDWDRKYRDLGLVIVGVHAPEFEFEKKLDNVKAAISQHGIEYPVALDNKLSTWLNFHNGYWPAHYLINKEGQVVYTHFGEGEYDVTENNIRYLLGLKPGGENSHVESNQIPVEQTPETYLGYTRAARFGGKEPLVHDAQSVYRIPSGLSKNDWALKGKWKVLPDKVISAERGAAININFTARKVFLVLGNSSGKPIHATLKLNGKIMGDNAGKDAPAGSLTIERNTLYELIDQRMQQHGLLEIQSDEPGMEVFAFTFG